MTSGCWERIGAGPNGERSADVALSVVAASSGSVGSSSLVPARGVLAARGMAAAPGPESSILKFKGTELQQAVDELFVEAAGYYALPYVPSQYTLDFPADERVGEGAETRSSLTYFNFRKATIYAGSNEIQKNIIAKHVLGL